MQFVFDHTTFDPQDEMDKAALAPLGVKPGQPYDPAKVAKLDGKPMNAMHDYMVRMPTKDDLPPPNMPKKKRGNTQVPGKDSMMRLF